MQDRIDKIKDGTYMNRNRPTSIVSKNSQESFPVRLDASNASESSDHQSSEVDTPEEYERIYQDIFGDVKTNTNQKNVTSISQKSKATNPQDTKREPAVKDWALTPLYEEYERRGKNVYPNPNEARHYTEDEVARVYEFIESRYGNKANDKAIITFYQKAMDTLFLLTDDQLDFNTYRKIQEMYAKPDVTNTLKLLLRCRLIYQARRQIVDIFDNIRLFKVLRAKAKNLINLHMDFLADAKLTTSRLRKVCKEIEMIQKQLLESLVSFLKNHKLFGNKCFVFEKKEWLSYCIKEYQRIKSNAAKVGIKMKEIKELEK